MAHSDKAILTTPSSLEAQTFTASERRLTLAGLMIVFLLSAIDQTVVATAMPRIVSELHGLSLYPWVTTAYLLASTVMIPIYGKLSDLYGRKAVLLTGVGIFTFGSGLCGMAGEFGALPLLGGGMVQLIVFRALQGLGGAALFTSAFAIIADIFPPRERGRFAGLFGAVFGLASLVGPVIGGFFTQIGTVHLGALEVQGWRWIFYVNLPLASLALFMIAVKMPALTRRIPGRIDFPGAALILITFVPLLLALSWGGRDYPWGSPRILLLLAVSAVGLCAFIFAELRSDHPILSLRLFRNRTFTTANLSTFIVSTAFMGVATFLPLYLQLGLGAAPAASGIAMLPLMVGLILASTASGFVVNKTGRFKTILVCGLFVMACGVVLLVAAPAHATLLDIAWRVFVMGLGLGPTQSLYALAVQNAVGPTEIGVATSTSQFFRQVGSTIGVAVFGTVLTNNLAAASRALGGPRTFSLASLEQVAAARQAATPGAAGAGLDAAGQAVIALAMKNVFLSALFVLGLGLVATALIPPARLRGRGPVQPEAPKAEPPETGVAAPARPT